MNCKENLMDSGVLELLTALPQLQEEIVPDHRAELRPFEIVQAKLLSLMPGLAVPVSCLHACRETHRANSISG